MPQFYNGTTDLVLAMIIAVDETGGEVEASEPVIVPQGQYLTVQTIPGWGEHHALAVRVFSADYTVEADRSNVSFASDSKAVIYANGDPSEYMSLVQGIPPAIGDATEGVYLASRFNLVVLALLLGVTFLRVYQEGRKGGK